MVEEEGEVEEEEEEEEEVDTVAGEEGEVDTGGFALDEEEVGREVVRRETPSLLSSRPPLAPLMGKKERPWKERGTPQQREKPAPQHSKEGDQQHQDKGRATTPKAEEGEKC